MGNNLTSFYSDVPLAMPDDTNNHDNIVYTDTISDDTNPQIRLEELNWHFTAGGEQRSVEVLRQLVANGLTSWDSIAAAGLALLTQVTDREAAAILLRVSFTLASPVELECFCPSGLLRLTDGRTSEYAVGARVCPHPILILKKTGPVHNAQVRVLHCSDTHDERYSHHTGERYDIFIFSGDFAPQHMILQANSPGVEEHVRRFNNPHHSFYPDSIQI
jgi:hypothetical protein